MTTLSFKALSAAVATALALAACSTSPAAQVNPNRPSAEQSEGGPSSAPEGSEAPKAPAGPNGEAIGPTSAPFGSPSPEGSSKTRRGTLPDGEAELDPICVAAGGVMSLHVDTKSDRSNVVYMATYSDGRNGAKYPWGDDLGGNGGGPAPEGKYTDAWQVSVEAPAGPASVRVVIGYSHRDYSGFKELDLPFTVRDPITQSRC